MTGALLTITGENLPALSDIVSGDHVVAVPANGGPLSKIPVDALRNGGGIVECASFTAATVAEVGASAPQLRTLGRFSPGDGGGATYVRWAAPMAALAAGQEDFSWFESGDGAQWTLADTEIRPEMFGAMGHATNDEGLAIRRMFEFAPGRTVLITKMHRYKSLNNSQDIRIYSNTNVRGISALTCGFKRIPNSSGELLATPSYGVYWQDADNIEVNDIQHDAMRSGLGLPDESNQRVNGFLTRGRCTRIRRNRLIAKNCTGYGFYNGAVGADKCEDVVGTDCVAINCQVSFETTGAGEGSLEIRPDSRQFVDDAGIAVNYECGYHQYGGIGSARYIQPKHRGSNAPAVLSVMVEDGLANGSVVYEYPDFETTGAAGATVIVRNDFFSTVAHPGNGKRSVASFIGGRISNPNGPATNFVGADVDIDGTQIVSRTVTLDGGANSLVNLRGDFDIQCIMPVSVAPASAAVAVSIDPTCVAKRTPTGSISAVHNNGGSEVAVSGTLSTIDDTLFDPPLPAVDSGTHVGYRWSQTWVKQTGGDGAVNIIANGTDAAGDFRYWVSQVLSPQPLADGSGDWYADRIEHIFSWRGTKASNITTNPTIKADVLWVQRTNNEVGLTITTKTSLAAGDRLVWTMRERFVA